MKLRSELRINNKVYPAGSNVPWTFIYPFFLIHMLAFGGSGFFMAYMANPPALAFLYMHGGIAILVYLAFYLTLFGLDEVKWMFLNALLGVLGIVAQLDWILGLFGREFDDYSWPRHVIPFLYYVFYTFLLRQALLDISGARENEARASSVNNIYVLGSVAIYLFMLQSSF